MSHTAELKKRRTRFAASVAAVAVLGLVLMPASAPAGNKVGGGAVTGMMSYGPPGIPQPLAPGLPKCNMPATFVVSAGAVVIDTQIVGYAGPVTISNRSVDLISGGQAQGANRTNCESFLLGSGRLSVDLQGKNQVNGAEISCDNIDGTWIRVFDAIEIALNGRCQIGDAFTTSPIAFVGAMSHTPAAMDVGGGLTHAYTSASVSGAFVITPG